MNNKVASRPAIPGRAIKQRRSQLTYNALINAGFRLLNKQDMESITVAEIARQAGYSVGAFYTRFHSKDEFLDALLTHHMEFRSQVQAEMFSNLATRELPEKMIENVVTYYQKRRRFWRAVLVRSVRDPGFWEPVRRHGHRFTEGFMERISAELGRPLDKREQADINFAFQMTLGMINSTLLNHSGPIGMGQSLFVEELARAFRLVSNYDGLLEGKARR